MLADEDLKTAIDDARARHVAVVQLIQIADTHAMSLLTFYTTLGVAAATGAAAGLSNAALLPRAAGWALASVVPVAVFSAVFCFLAMRTTRLNLPGREAKFWLWALDPAVARRDVFVEYLKNLATKNELNNRVNERTGGFLRIAKLSGIAIPVISLSVGLSALWLRF
jgi:hypothetical protein